MDRDADRRRKQEKSSFTSNTFIATQASGSCTEPSQVACTISLHSLGKDKMRVSCARRGPHGRAGEVLAHLAMMGPSWSGSILPGLAMVPDRRVEECWRELVARRTALGVHHNMNARRKGGEGMLEKGRRRARAVEERRFRLKLARTQ